MSLLSLIVCAGMLIGTSYAWFTDSVTSTGNVIQSGKLKVGFSWADGKDDPETVQWKDASTGAIFGNDELWEPGYVAARHISVENKGTLALQYWLSISVNGQLEKNNEGHTLADAIDVYFLEEAAQITDRASFEAAVQGQTPIPLAAALKDMSGMTDKTHGILYPDGTQGQISSKTQTIALKMRESAGNEYQDMELGASFSIQLYATQWTYEKDSFDEKYDELAYGWDNYADVSADVTQTNVHGALYFSNDTDARLSAYVPSVNPDGTADANALRYTTDAAEFYDFDVNDHDDTLVISAHIIAKDDTSATYDISLLNKTHNTVLKGLNKVVVIRLLVPAGLENVTVRHSGVSMNKAASADTSEDQTYYYDADTGILTVNTSTFSEFRINWGQNSVFSEYLNINPITGIDIIPDGYNIGITKDQVDEIAGQIGAENLNSIMHGAVYVPADGGNDSQLLLQNGRQYEAADEDAYQKVEEGKYQYWHGDFVMKFNKPVNAFTDMDNIDNTIILTGEYGSWGWLKIPCPVALEADQEYRMINDFMGGAVTINFEELCSTVKQFNCGAIYLNSNYDASDPLEMTVEFRMYETLSAEEAMAQGYGSTVNHETGNYITVDTFTYRFQ